jgi:hypothetical protein
MRGFWQEDKSDDQFAEKLSRGVEAMSDRRTLIRFIWILGTINLLIWLSVLIVPVDVRDGFDTVSQLNRKVGGIVLALVLGLGMWLSYSLLRLKFPDIEEQRLDADVMGSFAYQSDSTKKYRVWLFSAIGGIVNLGLMILAVLVRTE